MQRIWKIASIIACILLVIGAVFFYSNYIVVNKIKCNYRNVESIKIPKSLNNMTVAFISDIKYGEYMNQSRLEGMLQEFSRHQADVIVFGGDLFSKNAYITDQDINEVTQLLKSIHAPCGKFAILGDEDMLDDKLKKNVLSILNKSDFEIISNKNIQIRKDQDSGSISLIGLDSYINNKIDIEKVFLDSTPEEFQLLVTHCPDILTDKSLRTQSIDVALAGHSLGGQINIPLFGSSHKIKGATTYYSGENIINNTTLFVSNGLGTQDSDMRLFAPPEILIIRLQHVEKTNRK